MSNYFAEKGLEDLVLVAVDFGISKRARDMAGRLGVPVAVIEKRRTANDDRSETLNVIGDVRGKRALTFDDEILTGGTIVNAANALLEAGVPRCSAAPPIRYSRRPPPGSSRKAPSRKWW
ncbi:Ribose-phosphate pyrophosphokinase [Geodia barretti]|uniref:Ribose-phosphate pyrophosphokinase n=1 Tax=Geodia barretti TaxID=519541 RepID=A0AA35X989_GEOBA|nr:Ribose-phosphate pyrophosphokinase [Geodia barretti]